MKNVCIKHSDSDGSRYLVAILCETIDRKYHGKGSPAIYNPLMRMIWNGPRTTVHNRLRDVDR